MSERSFVTIANTLIEKLTLMYEKFNVAIIAMGEESEETDE